MNIDRLRVYPSFLRLILLVVACLTGLPDAAFGSDETQIRERERTAVELSKTWQLDSTTNALELFQQTAADWERLGETERAVFCLNEAAKLAQINSDYPTAFRLLRQALKSAANEPPVAERIVSLSLYALFSLEKSDQENARQYSEQAVALSRKLDSARAGAYAYHARGMFAYYYGNMKDATGHFERAAAFADTTDDIYIISQTLIYVGFSHLRNGNPDQVSDKMRAALTRCEHYGYKKGVALSFSGLAFYYYYTNAKQTALEYFKKSAALFPPDFEWMEKARITTLIGLIYMDFGELKTAESDYEKAIEYYERANYLLGRIATMTLLADTYLLESDLVRAKETYLLALRLNNQTDDKFRLASIKEGLGNAAFRQNDYEQAAQNYLAALQLYDQLGSPSPSLENLIGNAYQHKGDLKTARRFFESSLQKNQQRKDFQQTAETLDNLAKIDLLENRPDRALDNIDQSIDLTENIYSNLAFSNLKRSFLSNSYQRYELYIHLLMQKQKQSPNEDFAIQALQANERARSRSLLETLRLSEANFTKDANPDLVRREKEILDSLNLKADKLTELLGSKGEKSEIESIEGEMRTLTNELEEIRAKFRQESPIYSAIKNPPMFNIAEFQQNVLDERTVLLEFSLGEKESYLWLVEKNGVTHYVLPAGKTIEQRVERIHGSFEGREKSPGEEIEAFQKRLAELDATFSREAGILSQELLGQAAEKINGKRLIIVPDGKLHYLPLAALPFPNSDEFLAARHEIVYEPSAALLNVLAGISVKNRPQKDLLVVADPVFNDADPRLLKTTEPGDSPAEAISVNLRDFRLMDSNGRIPRLPASQDEAAAIQNIIGQSHTVVANGFAASRDQVLDSTLGDYRILHFATHGLIDIERPEVSSIVLSQYDENGRKQEGFLRLADIYGLNLAAELVVLSTCRSGFGKEVKGEGLMSLNNAFLQAGARSVLSSAWKVDDYATAELMKYFYRGLAEEHLTPAAALQRAQTKMRENPQFSSPFYWAAFTVQGEFRHPVFGPKTSYQLPAAVVLGSILLLGLGLFWKFRIGRSQRTTKL